MLNIVTSFSMSDVINESSLRINSVLTIKLPVLGSILPTYVEPHLYPF